MTKKKKIKTMVLMKSAEPTYGFPHELVEEILSRSPAKSLLRFKCVSKAWRALISYSKFINLHHDRAVHRNKFSLVLSNPKSIYSVIDDPTTAAIPSYALNGRRGSWDFLVRGCCDGLLLLVSVAKDLLRIWNPTTRDFRDVPSPSKPVLDTLYGLGYGSNRNDYQVVTVRCKPNVEVEIFSMQSQSWRRVESTNAMLSIFDSISFSVLVNEFDGNFANGANHWLGYSSDNATNNKEWKVISFDLGGEEFKGILLPEQARRSHCDPKLIVRGESIYLFIDDLRVSAFNIFAIEEYGVRDSWCQLYTIPDSVGTLFDTFCFMDDGKILLHENRSDPVLYDPKSGESMQIKIWECLSGNLINWFSIHAYTPSLVSIQHPRSKG
ncbi:hypothetical protein Sjap_019972 [Stephania japonica]|uniref:F-box domain-containing protein n=1 Tax=Stephania japonica TaxID=461633 RepID=A0AAP0HV90_9MAGN